MHHTPLSPSTDASITAGACACLAACCSLAVSAGAPPLGPPTPNFLYAVLDAQCEQFAVLAADGTIVAANQRWQQHGSASQLGANFLTYCGQAADWAGDFAWEEGDARRAEAGIRAVLAGKSTRFQLDYSVAIAAAAAASDSYGRRWMRLTASGLAQDWGGAVLTLEDISERHEAETSLRIAATAFESAEGLMVTDAAGIILKVNHAFTRITGYPAEEAVGRTPRMLSSGRHDASFYRAMWHEIDDRGCWEGEIWNRRKNGDVYPERLSIAAVRDADGQLSNYVAALSDITQSKAANEEIRNLAFYDPLTRLPNRRMLVGRLRQAVEASAQHERYGALLFIDLDHFKTLNDTLGHNVGDLLLQQVGSRLQGCVRQGDTVARLGGDEFVVLLEGLGGDQLVATAHTRTLAEKILSALNQPYTLGTHRCHSTPSMGATLFHAGRPAHPDQLLMQADIAMYQAKQAGRNGLRFFDQTMQDTINVRARLEQALRDAIDGAQFELHYQVQMDQHEQVVGAEALLRWRQADGSAMAPASFLPLAEQTGLILPIGQWVLETACEQLRQWQEDTATAQLRLAVNISAVQFNQPGFCQQVQQLVQRYGINASRLKLELSEAMLLDDIEHTILTMQQLRQIGVRFSLDDFGTGYSSLLQLKRLPLDQLKIDRSFVCALAGDSEDYVIVQAIIAMSRSLGWDVIAEGVESAGQRQLLEQLGCRRYQGYWYSRPLPATQFRDWLAQRAGKVGEAD